MPQEPDFINQYLLYNAGNMSPRKYHMWSALVILAMAMGRRIYVDHDYFRVHCMLYVTLVGRQGIRKTTAKDMAKAMFFEVFPDYPVGASVQTREKIVERLSSDDCLRAYQDETGAMIEFKPTAFMINELKNFMSINPGGMVEFLTDIYDTKFFASDTIKHGLQPIINPCINILACETPNWIIEKLKLNIIAGGFSRRMLYIYEIERPERITFPVKSEESKKAEEWCKAHLKKISTIVGPFKWEPEAREFFDHWFKNLPNQEDEILEGYYEAKDILVQKIAMLLAAAQQTPRLIFTKDILIVAIAFLESIEENLPKLTIAAGRNELAIPQQAMMEVLEANKGLIHEPTWHRLTGKNMNELEYSNAKKFFRETKQTKEFLYTPNGKTKELFVATWAKWAEMVKNGEVDPKS